MLIQIHTCDLCGSESSSVMHCLFYCLIAMSVWGLMEYKLKLPPHRFRYFMDMVSFCLEEFDEDLMALFFVVVYLAQ